MRSKEVMSCFDLFRNMATLHQNLRYKTYEIVFYPFDVFAEQSVFESHIVLIVLIIGLYLFINLVTIMSIV